MPRDLLEIIKEELNITDLNCMTFEERALIIHGELCTKDHVSTCSFFYEKTWNGHEKSKWLRKVHDIEDLGVDLVTAVKVFHILR